MLTATEKISLLRAMIRCIEQAQEIQRPYGLCMAFYKSMGIGSSSMLDLLPELAKYESSTTYWFPCNDYDTRIRICEDVITELEKQLTCG